MMNVEGSTFTFHKGGVLSFQYANSRLPIAMASVLPSPSASGYLASTCRMNISKTQAELLLWYSTLGHYNIANTQKLMSSVGVDTEPMLRLKEPGIHTCSLSLCVVCVRGKGRAT